VVVASRDLARAEAAVHDIAGGEVRLHVAELDLASLASVRTFPDRLDVLGLPPIGALVCNAGVQIVDGTRYTEDGIEETFAVNVLGHFLLVKLLLGRLGHGARVIFISSGTHDPSLKTGMPVPRYTNAAELAAGEGLAGLSGAKLGRARYTTSKLCSVYLAYELAKRYPLDNPAGPAVVASAMDPGLMAGSGLARNYGALSRLVWNHVLPVASRFIKGASTTTASGADVARLATAEAFARESGVYYIGAEPSSSSVLSYDQFNAVDLWNTCATLSGVDP
jgi:NAD(P)-dependent dehydrogenase (short-subunit alcohol dehydrogenase family)